MNKVFKVGDKVRVVKRIDSIDSPVCWVDDMDKYVGDGEIYTVIESDHKGRVRLDKAVNSNYHWLFPNEALELVNDVDEEYSEEIRVGDSVVVVGTYFTKTAGLDPDLSPFSKDPVEVVDILGKTGIAKLSTGEYYHLKDLEIVDPNFSSEFKVGDTVKVINKVEHERGWANSWVSSMDKYIGSTCVVLEVDPVFGIVLDTGYGLYFPPSSLELVSEVKDCPFKVGDKVVIKNEGLLKQWIIPSDLSGQIATIHSLQLDDCPSAHLEEHGGYFFPLDCLELAHQNTDGKFNVVDIPVKERISQGSYVIITHKVDVDYWASDMTKCINDTIVRQVKLLGHDYSIVGNVRGLEGCCFPDESLEVVFPKYGIGDSVQLCNTEGTLSHKSNVLKIGKTAVVEVIHFVGGKFFYRISGDSTNTWHEDCLCPKSEEESVSESTSDSLHELSDDPFYEEDANSKIREILSKHGITISADKDLWDCVINAGLALSEYYNTLQK